MRVTAIESFKNGVVRKYGDGELIEKQVPDIKPFNRIKVENPCIKLDNGKYVWGFQCWWGDIDDFKKKYKKYIKETIIVDIENEVLPLEEKCIKK